MTNATVIEYAKKDKKVSQKLYEQGIIVKCESEESILPEPYCDYWSQLKEIHI